MQTRMDYYKVHPKVYSLMGQMEKFIKEQDLDPVLYELIKIRASQINGCAFCLDAHTRDLRKMGETEERIALTSVWRECTYYTNAEKAVLHLTEVVTEITVQGVPKDVYNEVLKHFSEKQYMDIIVAINTINNWNRIAISTGMFPGCKD